MAQGTHGPKEYEVTLILDLGEHDDLLICLKKTIASLNRNNLTERESIYKDRLTKIRDELNRLYYLT